MPTYVTLYKYTAQGIQNIKEAPNRVETLTKAAKQAGMTVKETLWLQGRVRLHRDRRRAGRNCRDRIQYQQPEAGQRHHAHHARVYVGGNEEDPRARRLGPASERVFHEAGDRARYLIVRFLLG
jgi:hypothetical protein